MEAIHTGGAPLPWEVVKARARREFGYTSRELAQEPAGEVVQALRLLDLYDSLRKRDA